MLCSLPAYALLVPQAELEEAHKADPVAPSMTPEEQQETERVFKDF